MTVTGVLSGLFVIVHMLGNLKIFADKENFNAYAAFLRTIGTPAVPDEGVLWILRIILLIAIVLYIFSGLTLATRAKQSRDKLRRQGMASSWNTSIAHSIIVTDIVLLAFIILYLLDLTVGAGVAPSAFEHGEMYQNVVASFSHSGIVVQYTIAQLALLLYLSHGLRTATSNPGITGKRWYKVLLFLSSLLSLLAVVSNIFIPVTVLTGLVS